VTVVHGIELGDSPLLQSSAILRDLRGPHSTGSILL